MTKQDDLERRALEIIMKSGDKGILQSDLWRKINVTSREGSRISIRLESKGLIRREPELSRGRWTFRLYPKHRPASIDSILNCPCISCKESSICGANSIVTPNDCEKFTRWILEEES
ncbi:MAG: Lrp/AsnC family transcriptional regulator [Candidatus Bathyarchaeia archaeon]